MAILIRIFIGLIVLVLALAVIGFFLPNKFRIERSVTIAAPAEKIYPMIAETRNWRTWTMWNERDPDMKIDYSGPASGAGAKWVWQSKSEGNGAMEFTAAELNKGVTYKLSFPEFGMNSIGVLSLTPDPSGTSSGTYAATKVT